MSADKITPGKFVSLTYSICDETGRMLEQHDLPVSYIHGGDVELIGGMDRAVAGKRAGDTLEVLVPPEQGFGRHDPALTFTDDIDNVPPELRYLGAEIAMQNEAGEMRTFYVTRIDNGRLTIDGNHPMAGKTLKVHVRIAEVRDPTQADLLALSGGPQTLN